MKEITLHGSNILVGERLENLKQHLPKTQVIVITNPTISKLYGKYFEDFKTIELKEGEKYKTLDSIAYITKKLIEFKADRDTFILGFGGGIICDITGFVASIFMRGCRFGFVSTTLLSQVDASIGGKNGVNFEGYKNILGVFNQPQIVLCDPAVFSTLSLKEYVAGFAEIVKAAMITDVSLFEYAEQNAGKALNEDADVMEHLVYESVKIKADIVTKDEYEHGERRKLNLGHTFAHAIEKISNLSHGEAVSIGLVMASQTSVQLGLMREEEKKRVVNILNKLTLPIAVNIPHPTLFDAIHKDKKKSGNSIHIILPVGIGDCEVHNVLFSELELLISKLSWHL
ncbi:MAG: 3-dehydroquinate synthase [Prevotellaceae bacterium]|jgi:3-dehydroquinate synthase|nr:3-dehydroquinate synthase [Prevotellaceae bacterium]